MITILKETPITFHGVDCKEYLLEDDSIVGNDCCEFCIYHSWHSDDYLLASCMDVHGCGNYSCYFQILPLLDK